MGYPDSELQVRYVSWASWSSNWYFERGVWVRVWGGDVLGVREVYWEARRTLLILYDTENRSITWQKP